MEITEQQKKEARDSLARAVRLLHETGQLSFRQGEADDAVANINLNFCEMTFGENDESDEFCGVLSADLPDGGDADYVHLGISKNSEDVRALCEPLLKIALAEEKAAGA
jgi:hypothetical protein